MPSIQRVEAGPPFSKYALPIFALVILLSYSFFRTIQVRRKFSTFALQEGCLDAPERKRHTWMFGADTIYESWQWKSQHRYLDLLHKHFDDYGLTYTSQVFGTNKLTTIDPANVEAILKTKWTDFIARPARKIPLDGLVGPGVLTADGELWKSHRKLMAPSFSRSALEDFSIYNDHFEALLPQLPRDGTVVDLQDLFFKLTMDSSTAHLFGCSSRTLTKISTPGMSSGPDLAGAFDRAQRAAVDKFALGWIDRFRPQPQYWRDTKRVWKFAERYVDLALKRKQNRKSSSLEKDRSNFLDELCERTEDYDAIHKGTLHLLVAGRDSTASLLSNLWFVLARNERVWCKLKSEIDSLGDVLPTNDVLKKLPYLRACINESLRCHPAIPWSLRAAAQDTTLPSGGGPDGASPIALKKGTTVLIPLYCLHRRKEFWGANADEFEPDRWNSDLHKAQKWTYIPFLAGPRMCLGYQFAINTASYVTIRLIQQLESIAAADDGPWREELGLSMTSAGGARMSLRFKT